MKLLLPTKRDREAHQRAVEVLLVRNARLLEPDENPSSDERDEGDHRV